MKKQTIWFNDGTSVGGTTFNGTTAQGIKVDAIPGFKDTRYQYPDAEYGIGSRFKFYEKAADGDKKVRIVEGMASTDAVDRANEIVDPESFRANLASFKDFPVLLLNHQFFAQPIGKIVEAEIREHGLFVRVEISQTADDVWTLIQEGVLKAFSIGFRGLRVEVSENDAEPDIWREIELIEISIVNVPANREALFSVAESRGMSLSGLVTKEADSMKPEEIKAAVAEGIKANEPVLTEAAKQTAQSEVKVATQPLIDDMESVKKQMADISEAIKSRVTDADLNEKVDAVKADMVALQATAKRLAAPGLPNYVTADFNETDPDSFNEIEKSWLTEFKTMQVQHIKALCHSPAHYFEKGSAQFGAMEKFQTASDTLYVLFVLAHAHNPIQYPTMKSLSYWTQYQRHQSEFRKAMDTGTANTGGDWMPTNFSAQLFELIERYGQIEPLFTHFPMTAPTYEWPFDTTTPTAFLPGEATAVTESAPLVAKATFTAKKLAVYTLTSSEFNEDSVIAAMSYLTKALARGLSNGIEDAILSGDTAGTHEDSDVTAGTDRRKAWKGLRASANDGDGSVIYRTTATNADGKLLAADQRAARASMDVYGIDPRELAHIVSLVQYIKLMDDSNVLTIDKFGSAATILAGELMMLDGSPVRWSQGVRQVLNATAVEDGSVVDRTVSHVVHHPSWLIGDRRIIQVETDRILLTDRIELLATRRLDFESVAGPHGATGAPKNIWTVMNLAGN